MSSSRKRTGKAKSQSTLEESFGKRPPANERHPSGSPADKKTRAEEAQAQESRAATNASKQHSKGKSVSFGAQTMEDDHQNKAGSKASSAKENATKEVSSGEDTDEEMREATDEEMREDKDEWTEVPQKKLASVFDNSTTRTHQLYITFRAEIPPSSGEKGDTPTVHCRSQFKEFLTFLQNQMDESTVIYRYEPAQKDERDAIIRPTAFPKQLNTLKEYGSNVNPIKKGGKLYISLRIGFNGSVNNFEANLQAEAKANEMFAKVNKLQVPKTVKFGYLAYFAGKHDEQHLVRTFNTFSKNCVDNKGLPPIKIALDYHFVFEGTERDDRKHWSEEQEARLKAYHVSADATQVERAKRVVKAFLQSKLYAAHYNVPARLVSTYKKNRGGDYEILFKRTLVKHSKIAHTVTQFTAPATHLVDPDKPLNTVEGNPTTRQLILNFKNQDGEKIFKSVDRVNFGFHKGKWQASYRMCDKKEAERIFEYLPKYLERYYGDGALEMISQEGCQMVDELGWDEKNKCPISLEQMELDSVLGDNVEDEYAKGLDFDKIGDFEFTQKVEIERPPEVDEGQQRSQRGMPDYPANRADDKTLKSFNSHVSAATTYSEQQQPPAPTGDGTQGGTAEASTKVSAAADQ